MYFLPDLLIPMLLEEIGNRRDGKCLPRFEIGNAFVRARKLLDRSGWRWRVTWAHYPVTWRAPIAPRKMSRCHVGSTTNNRWRQDFRASLLCSSTRGLLSFEIWNRDVSFPRLKDGAGKLTQVNTTVAFLIGIRLSVFTRRRQIFVV